MLQELVYAMLHELVYAILGITAILCGIVIFATVMELLSNNK